MKTIRRGTKPNRTRWVAFLIERLAIPLLLAVAALSARAQGLADLGVSQTGDPTPVGTSSNITYSLTVTNAGPDAASGIVLTDFLPAGVSFVSASSGCLADGSVVQCTVGGLTANTSVTLTIVVTVTLCGGSVTNQASVAGDQFDPNPADNASSAVNTILPVSAPFITVQPQSVAVPMRNGAVFAVTASAAAPLTYQWQTNGVNILDGANVLGSTTASLAVSNLTLAANGTQFRVIVTDCAGSSTSLVAILTVAPVAGISFDFNTPGQYTNAPYNLVDNDWINNVLRNQQPYGPIDLFEVSTGGVGVATGGGALDLTFNQADDQTSTFVPLTYDFSLPGQVLQASVMFKLKVPAAVQRATQIGFLTATNGHPSVGNNVLTGLSGTSGQCFMSAIFQSTVVNTVTPSYQLRAQWKGAAGTALTESIPVNNPTNTLSTNRWYKFTAKFVNTSATNANSSTVESTLQDMGADGVSPGAVVLRMAPQTTLIPDVVRSNKFYFAVRGFENGGIDYYDQWFVTTVPGPITFVAPLANQTVLQGRTASFRALVDGDGPYTYQWYKNGVPIAGAGNWKYTTPPLLFPGDNGAQFSVTVTSPNNSISSMGVVTVVSDNLGLLSAGSVEGSVIGLRFNQPVDRMSAEIATNYTVNGTPAVAAQLLSLNGVQQYRTNGTELLLTPAAPVSGPFVVRVSGVASLSGTLIGANNSFTGVVAALTGLDVDPTSIGENGQVPTLPGYSYSFAPGQFTIIGGGHDIFGVFDGFRFTYKQVSGDFDVKVRVPYEDMVRGPAKAGFDVRVSLDPASPNVGAFPNPFLPGRNFFEGTVRQLYNVPSTSWGNQTMCTYPNTWLRFRRVANTFMRYSSTNGVNWLFDGQISPFPSFPDTLYLGLAVDVNVGVGVAQQYNTAQFDSYGNFAGYSSAAIAITAQPVDAGVSAGSPAILTVLATLTGNGVPVSAGELAYLWQRTNVSTGGWTNMPNAGATNNVLSTGSLVATDQNAQYRVIVSAPGALSVTSSVATITVTDTNPPTVLSSLVTPLSPGQLVITFSELMDAATALNAANYNVTNGFGAPVTVTSVSFLNGDQRTVVITLASPLVGGTNSVGINGLRDLNGNTIFANTVRPLIQSAGATAASGPQLLGPVVAEFYTGLPSFGGIGDLVNHQKYSRGGVIPNGSPDFYVYSNVFGIHPGTSPTAAFPSAGWGENYGARIYSYFKPAASGSYKFYSRVDDFGELWMNTNADPALSTLPLDVVVGTSTNSPVAQQTWMCLDGVKSNYANSKYLNGDINNSGFYVTPAIGDTVVGGMRFWSANDAPERDPMTFTIEGSTNPVVAGYPPVGGPWILIASGGTGLSTNRYFPGADIVFTNALTGAYTNTTPYRSYRVIFPTVRNSPSAANSMQIGEVQFLGTNGAVVVPSGATMLIQTTAFNSSYTNTLNSSNIFLNAGQLYYMELRYKETGGGDGGTVAVRTDAAVPGNNEVISNQFLVFPINLAPATPIQFEAYSVLAQSQNANNGGIADLIVATNLTNFIARIPNMAGYTKIFGWNTNLAQGGATMDNYLGRIYACFIAPSNGVYKFWMRSDDSSQLLMNTNAVNSTDPAGAQVIGQLNVFTPAYTLVAQGISLLAGQRYYMEARWRDGIGADGLCVMVKSQGDSSIPGLAEVIPGSFFELATNETRFGPIKLAGISPGNPTVNEGQTITFQAVGVSGQGSAQGAVANQTVNTSAGTTEAMPLLNLGLVWMKNGLNVMTSQVFAGQMYYVTPPLSMADNGSVITLLVSNTFSIATQSVKITVVPAVPPMLVSAVASQYGDSVLVTFSEPVDSFTSQCLADYGINGGVKILSVKRDDVRRDRVSLVTTRQSPNTTYTLTVNGVRALSDAGPAIAPASTINFSSWGTGGIGGVYVEIFTNIPGTLDEFLQFSPRYVYDMPDVSYYTNNFGVGQFGADSGLNNYAARVSALFTPPSNGLYRFFVRGDDGTRLFMNTNGPDPAGKVLIARNDAANSASNLTVNPPLSAYQTGIGLNIAGASISPIISLTNGTAYWMEALMKEAFFGDYLEVLMRAIDPVTGQEIGGLPLQPGAGNTINTANGQIGLFGMPGNPDLAAVVSAPPASIFVHEDDLFTLSLVLRGTGGSEQFASVQWQRFDPFSTYTNIPGATSLSYSRYAALSDNGSQFRVNFSMPGWAGTFVTRVTVLPDTIQPSILSVGSVDGNSIGVCFNERINFTPGSPHSGAVDTNAYLINGSFHPTSVLPRADGKSAVLVLASQVSGAFTVQLTDFSDVAQSPSVQSDSGVIAGTVLGLTPLDVGVQGTSGPGQYNFLAAGLPPYPQNPFSCTNGGLDVIANGWDIWNGADGFHFDYARPMIGDFDVRVRLQTLTGADQWSKAGLIARGSTDSNSRFIEITATPATTPIPLQNPVNSISFQWRDVDGAFVSPNLDFVSGGLGVPYPNAWLRLQRIGNVFNGYSSADGASWTLVGSRDTGGMFPNTLVLGLGTESHDQTRGLANNAYAEYRDLYLPNSPVITAQPGPASQTVTVHSMVSYSVTAGNAPNSGALRYQWLKDGVILRGANGPTLTIQDAAVSDSGTYTVNAGNDGGAAVGGPVTLVVTNGLPLALSDTLVATQGLARAVSQGGLLANDSDPEHDPLSLLAVTGITPVTIGTNFDQGLLTGATLYGNATIQAGGGTGGSSFLALTPSAVSAVGSMVINEVTPGKRISAFTATFNVRIGDGTPEPADGLSFNFASDIPDAAVPPPKVPGDNAFAEQGAGNGFSFCIDNYRFQPIAIGEYANFPGGGAFNTSGMKINYHNIIIAGVQMPTWNQPRWVPVSITVLENGSVTILVDGTNVFGHLILPGYAPSTGRFAFFARCGGLNETHWVDDLSITVRSPDTALGGSVALTGGAIAYTPPPSQCGMDSFYYLASDGQAGGQSLARVDVAVVAPNPAPPTITLCPANRSVAACSLALPDLTSELVATDACCCLVVSQSPVAGTVVGLGPTVVTLTASNAAGLTASCQTTMTLLDTQPPHIFCASAVVLPLNDGENSRAVFYPMPVPVDNCPGALIGCSPPTGSTFPSGTTMVTCQATDAGGNHANCNFAVTLLSCLPAPPGLVSWWRAENNALDSVGTNHGTLANGGGFAAGKSGNAFSLDGVNDYIDVPNSPSLNPTNAITVEAWYMPTISFSGGNNGIVDKGYSSHSDPYYEYHLGVTGDLHGGADYANFNFSVAAGGTGVGVYTPLNGYWTLGNWYHLVGTYDGVAAKLYVNGSLIDSAPASGTLIDYGKSVRIGGVSNTGSVTPGLIDEVRIYNRALTSNEVAAIYAAGAAGVCKPVPFYVGVQGGGGVSRFPDQALYLPGDVVMLTATNGRYSGFQGWSDGNTNPTRAITVGFTNVFTAIFTNTVALEELAFQRWDKSFGGTGDDLLYSSQPTADGGFVLGGWSNSGADGNKTSPNFGGYDFWVVRLDGNGNKLWDRSFGGTGDDASFGLQQTSDGGFVLGGYSLSPASGNKTSPNFGGYDFWVVRLDSNGNRLWDRSFGGSGDDLIYAIQETTDGGFILGGWSNSGADGNKTSPNFGARDVWVVRLDTNGNKLWDRSFGGTSYDELSSVKETLEGGFILGGYSRSGADGNKTSPNFGFNDYWVVRLDANGNKLWDRSFGGAGDDQIATLQATADGGFILAGDSNSGADGNKASPSLGNYDFWVVRLDADGNKLWDRSFGGTDYDVLTSLQQMADGGFMLGGVSNSSADGNKTSSNFGGYDFWVVRLDFNGNRLWDRTLGGSGDETLTSLGQTLEGAFILGGYSRSGANGSKTSPNFGNNDFWIVKLDAREAPVGTPTVLVNTQFEPDNAVQRTNSALVELRSTIPGARIYYTLNGAPPAKGVLYNGPFVLAQPAIVRAVVLDANFVPVAEADPVFVDVVAPPSIVTPPEGRVVGTGADVDLSVTASGTTPLSYQWLLDGLPVPGAIEATLLLLNIQPNQGGNYAVIITNAFGSITSAPAAVVVFAPPSISVQPASVTVGVGGTATFSISALGPPPLEYQWRKNGVNILDATNSTFTIFPVQFEDGATYTVVVASAGGTLESDPAVLTVTVPSPPAGDSFASTNRLFGPSGAATGTNNFATREPGEPLHAGKPSSNSVWYAWTAPATGIATFRTSGSTFDTLLAVYVGTDVAALTTVASDEDSGGFLASKVSFNAVIGVTYHIAIDGLNGQQGAFVLQWETLETATVVPEIACPPASLTVQAGQDATFTVGATGPSLTYQWVFNGIDIPGATQASYTRAHVRPEDVGLYSVRVRSTATQAVESAPAVLEIGLDPSVQSQDKPNDAPAICLGALNAHAAPRGAGASSVAMGSIGYQVLVSSSTNNLIDCNTTNCGGIPTGTRFLALQPSASGTLVLDTMGSASRTKIWVCRAGTNNLDRTRTYLTCDVDSAPDGRSQARFEAEAGRAYQIWISRLDETNGVLQLNWRLGLPPRITSLSPDAFLQTGASTVLSVTATNVIDAGVTSRLAGPEYAWYFNGAGPVATGSNLFLSGLQATDAGQYVVVASNPIAATSAVVHVEVFAAAERALVNAGGVTELFADATTASCGGAPAHYQWQLNGVSLSGQTNRSLFLRGAQPSQAGQYSVIVSNCFGRVVYPAATVAVTVDVGFSAGLPGNGQVILHWQTTPGKHYRVEQRASVEDAGWTPLQPDQTATSTSLTVTDAIGLASRFYRIVLLD